MAIQRIPQELINQAIPLNRASGESYDQGQQMTMQEAIRIAEQYGHVPARISSGPMGDDTMGVWAVPTERGWVPVDRLVNSASAAQSWQGAPSAPQGPSAPAPQTQGSGPIMGAINQWRNTTPPQQTGQQSTPAFGYRPTQSNLYAVPQSSSSGPITGQQSTFIPTNGQNYNQQPNGQPVVNVNIGGQPTYTGGNGGYDQSGWYAPQQQFQTGQREEVTRNQIYNGLPNTQPGGNLPTQSNLYATPSRMGMYDQNGWYTPQSQFQTGPAQADLSNQIYNGAPPAMQGPAPFNPQLSQSWSNAGPPGFAGNAMWQGQRAVASMPMQPAGPRPVTVMGMNGSQQNYNPGTNQWYTTPPTFGNLSR